MSLGPKGEKIAEAYLRSRRYQILERNWKVFSKGGRQIGELDIIAKNKDGYVFVEVKSGNPAHIAFRPETKLYETQIRKITRTARIWLGKRGALDQPWQIDLIAVDFSKAPPEIRHYCHVTGDS